MSTKTHCPHGHAYDEANTRIDNTGRNRCRACLIQRTKSWYDRIGGPKKIKARADALSARIAHFSPPPLIAPTYPASFGHWLTGFSDGEASFVLSTSRQKFAATFAIKLRADDCDILVKIAQVLKIGRLFDVSKEYSGGNACPGYSFEVRSYTELYNVIIPQFDAYPLQSKKAREYAIWRQAVILVCSLPRTRESVYQKHGPELEALCLQLKAVRQFR